VWVDADFSKIMGENVKRVKQPVKTIRSKVSRLNDYRGGGFTIERL